MNTNQAHHRLNFLDICRVSVSFFPFSNTFVHSFQQWRFLVRIPPHQTGLFSPVYQLYQQWPWPLPFSSTTHFYSSYVLNLEFEITDSQDSTWIALAGSIGLVLPSGSSVALLYGFIFCVLCCFCVAASLGELSSIWPTAGGQYHFVYALCTERWRKPMVRFPTWSPPDSCHILDTNK